MTTMINTNGSSAFVKLGYNDKGQILARFTDSPELRYRYSNVPAEKLQGLIEADSKGRYFAQQIRHDKTIEVEIY